MYFHDDVHIQGDQGASWCKWRLSNGSSNAPKVELRKPNRRGATKKHTTDIEEDPLLLWDRTVVSVTCFRIYQKLQSGEAPASARRLDVLGQFRAYSSHLISGFSSAEASQVHI
jgi:hypothetical protein